MVKDNMISPGSKKPISAPLPLRHGNVAASNRHRKNIRLIGVLLVILILLSAASVALVLRSRHADLNKLEDVEELISKHFILPNNEVPALATVTDKSKLTTPFLQQAEDGDKILIYQNAKKVIIYRPGTDRIVDAGPVSLVPLDASK